MRLRRPATASVFRALQPRRPTAHARPFTRSATKRAPGLGTTLRAGVWRARCVVGRRWQGMALRRDVRLASPPARPQRGVRFMGEQALI